MGLFQSYNSSKTLTFDEAVEKFETDNERAELLKEAYRAHMNKNTDFLSVSGGYMFKNNGCTSIEEYDRWSEGLIGDYTSWKKERSERTQTPENEPDIDTNGLRLSIKDLIDTSLKQYIQNTRPGYISVEMADGLNMQYEREDFKDIIDAIDNIVRDTKARMDIIRKAYKNENRDANFEDKLLPLVASIFVWETIKEANNKRKKSSNVSLEEYYPNSEYMTALINGTVKVKWTNKLDLTNIISPKFIKIRQEAKEKELNNKGYIFSLRAVLQRLGYDIDDMGYIEIPTMLDKSLGTVFDKCYFLVNIDDVWYGLNQDGYCTVEDSWINKFNGGGSTSVSARGSKVYNKKTETKLNVAQLSEKEAKELYQIASGRKIPKEAKQKEPPKTREQILAERAEKRDQRMATVEFRAKQRKLASEQRRNNGNIMMYERRKNQIEMQIGNLEKQLETADRKATMYSRNPRRQQEASDARNTASQIMADIDRLQSELEEIENNLENANISKVDYENRINEHEEQNPDSTSTLGNIGIKLPNIFKRGGGSPGGR